MRDYNSLLSKKKKNSERKKKERTAEVTDAAASRVMLRTQ